MWFFKGIYTGEAKAYIKKEEKKRIVICAWVFSVVLLLICIGMAIALGNGNVTLISVILAMGIGAIALMDIIFLIYYKRDPRSEIEITNDDFNIYDINSLRSFAFYNIDKIEDYGDFIVVKNMLKGKAVLQKDLLIEGDWSQLKNFLQKIEDSLATDVPIYQVDEPKTEFFEATVKGKRIYKKFVSGVSVGVPASVFQYFVSFRLKNDEVVEYEIGRELYEKIENGQKGTLVIIGGSFFDFGDGEELE